MTSPGHNTVTGKLGSCEACAAACAEGRGQFTARRQAEHEHSDRGGVVGGVAQRRRVRIRLQADLRKPTTKRTSKKHRCAKLTAVAERTASRRCLSISLDSGTAIRRCTARCTPRAPAQAHTSQPLRKLRKFLPAGLFLDAPY